MTNKYIIGLDLSTVATGYVRINHNGKVLDHDTFKIDSRKFDVDSRIEFMMKEVIKKLNKINTNIDIVILEDVYNIRRNTQCLLELRGAIKIALRGLGIEYNIIAANTARYLTWAIPKAPKGTKWSRDEKKQFVKDIVEDYFKIKFNNTDESDAALLCMAHLKSLEEGVSDGKGAKRVKRSSGEEGSKPRKSTGRVK